MPRFFLSYRRNDTEGAFLAHMIFRDLRYRYGKGSAFLDVDSRSPGLSFPAKVASALSQSDAVLVLIGPTWLSELKSRQNEQRDWVRYEIAESLKRPYLPVVPICRAGVRLPLPDELPPDLADLAWRDGISLDPFVDFDSHLSRLLADLERIITDLSEQRKADEVARRSAILKLANTVKRLERKRHIEHEQHSRAVARLASAIESLAAKRSSNSKN